MKKNFKKFVVSSLVIGLLSTSVVTNAMPVEDINDSSRYQRSLKYSEYGEQEDWFYDQIQLQEYINKWKEIDTYPLSKELSDYIFEMEQYTGINPMQGGFYGYAGRHANIWYIDLLSKKLTSNQRRHLTHAAMQNLECANIEAEIEFLQEENKRLNDELFNISFFHFALCKFEGKIEDGYYLASSPQSSSNEQFVVKTNGKIQYNDTGMYYIYTHTSDQGYHYKGEYLYILNEFDLPEIDTTQIDYDDFQHIPYRFLTNLQYLEMYNKDYYDGLDIIHDDFYYAIENSDKECVPIKKYKSYNGVG